MEKATEKNLHKQGNKLLTRIFDAESNLKSLTEEFKNKTEELTKSIEGNYKILNT